MTQKFLAFVCISTLGLAAALSCDVSLRSPRCARQLRHRSAQLQQRRGLDSTRLGLVSSGWQNSEALERVGRCLAQTARVSTLPSSSEGVVRIVSCRAMFGIDFNLNATPLAPSLKDPLSVFVCNGQFPLHDLLLFSKYTVISLNCFFFG